VWLGVIPWLLTACGRVGVDLLPATRTEDEPATQGEASTDAAVTDSAAAQAGAGMGAGAADRCLAACSNQHGSAQCVGGVCQLTCSAGFSECDGDGRNGCETNTSSDPRHCGACERSCDLATQLCEGGVCVSSPCPPGRAECDADPASMCETDLTSSAESCGFCGNRCIPEHAAGGCQDRSCVITSCDAGYADCDANAQTGCETALDSVENCGMCGRACPAEGGTPSCNAGMCSVSCTLTGSFALRLTLPTSWPATPLLSSGRGDFSFWGLVQLTQGEGGALSGTFTPCGELVPEFRATPLINERYGLIFPNALFDRSALLPGVLTSGVLDGPGPGSRLTLARTAFLIGARLADPVNGAWPSTSALGAVDVDGDGKPAASIPYKTGAGFTAPPVNNFGSFRAETAHLATRIVFSLEGVLDSCIASSGTVSAQDIEARTLGCRISPDLRDCLSSEASHLDDNTPDFVPSAGRFTLLKLASASCPAVRAALP
jgi:hypothetical protein